MKSVTANLSAAGRRDRAPFWTRLGLLAVFLLGAALIAAGMTGLRTFEHSGFSSETGYQAIHALSGSVASDWNKLLSPQLAALPADGQAALQDTAEKLLFSAWEAQKAGAAEEARALLAKASESERTALLYKLLYTTYQVAGPKENP